MDTNFIDKKIITPECLLVGQLCQPLELFGITLFDYVRQYDDGYRICLCNRPDWLHHFYAKDFHKHGSYEGKASLYPASYTLAKSLPFQSIFKEARSFYNIDNVIAITKPGINFCEFFFFAGEPNNFELENFYLNNLDLLDRFILFFKDKGANLITKWG